MDKNSSLRCLKFSLIAGNTAVIAFGLASFITGLVAPNALAHLMVFGSQLALVSSIVVVIGAAGLIGAIREHFCLLLTYAMCILAVFIFRLTWSLTTPLHQTGPFVMDTTVSMTILSSLAKLFLMIFAILLALTLQNSLPLTKEKFLLLKDKLKWNNGKNKQQKNKKYTASKDELDAGNHSLRKQIRSPTYSSNRSSSRSKVLKNDPNGIYVISNNNHYNIYESGRRRSKSPSGRPMNGHGHHHHSHFNSHGSSGRSRSGRGIYQGVGYSGPTSPNESGHSSASQDSNNNTKHHQNGNAKLIINEMQQQQSPQAPLTTTVNEQQKHQSLPRVPAPRRFHKLYSSSNDYVHYRSPSPPKSSTKEPEIKPDSANKFTNQPFFNPYRSVQKSSNSSTTSTTLTPTITTATSTMKTTTKYSSPLSPIMSNHHQHHHSQSKMPRETHYETTIPSSSSKPTSMLYSISANRQNPKSITTETTSTRPTYSSRMILSPTPTGSSTKKPNPVTTSIDTTMPRLYSSSPNIVSNSLSISGNVPTTTNSSNSIFTTPTYSSSYQFDTSKSYGINSYWYPASKTPTTTTNTATSTNLNQTRTLFSTYTSPLNELSSPSTSETNVKDISGSKNPVTSPPIPTYRSYKQLSSSWTTAPTPTTPTVTASNKQAAYSIKSPTPSPTNYRYERNFSSPISEQTAATAGSGYYHQQKKNIQPLWSSSIAPISMSQASSKTPTPPPGAKYTTSTRLYSSSPTTLTTTITTIGSSSIFTTTSTYSYSTPSNTVTYPRTSSNKPSDDNRTATPPNLAANKSSISNDKYRFFYSSNEPTTTSTTALTSNTNLFNRVYPKTYEEYVKSYRYPENTSSTLLSTSTTTSNFPYHDDNTILTIDQTSTPMENSVVIRGYSRSGGGNKTGSGINIEPLQTTTNTIMKTITTRTTHQEINEQQYPAQEHRFYFTKQHQTLYP